MTPIAIVPEGAARPGDVILTPFGTYVEVVAVQYLHEHLAQISARTPWWASKGMGSMGQNAMWARPHNVGVRE